MALTLSNTNYNGEVLENLYLVTGVGNEVVTKGAAKVITDISTKKALPRLSQTADPIGDYQAGVPAGVTATTTYAERELEVEPMTVYETFLPTTFHNIWQIWKSVGDFTNLELNAQLLNAILEVYKPGIGTQMSKLFWQGDKNLGANNPLNKFNGVITRGILDANVIKPTPAGNITDQNFMDILSACWSAIPDKFIDDPNFVLHVNTTDWKTMQSGNTKLKQAFVGVFGMSMEDMYQMKRIKHFQGLTRHHIVGAKVTNGEDSNLNLGVWVDPDSESVVVDKVANNSREWFLRLDFKADANYRCSEELVLYTPV
jgi:hypothetical protein